MNPVDHTIMRILGELRGDRTEEAWSICREALQATPESPARDRLRLYLGFCGGRKLRDMTVVQGNESPLVAVCTEAIEALQSAYRHGGEAASETAVEAAILLGDLCRGLRNHVPGQYAPITGDASKPRSGLVDVIRRLHQWSAPRSDAGHRQSAGGARHERDTNPLVIAYRCTRALYGMARDRADQLGRPEQPTNRRRASRRSTAGRSTPEAGARHRWCWAANMVLAEFAADFGGADAGPSVGDPADYLQEAMKHARYVGAGAIGEGLWAAEHGGVSFGAAACTQLALGRMHLAREQAVTAGQRFDDAYRRCEEAGDVHGRIAVLATRAELHVRLAEAAAGDERLRWCREATVYAERARSLLAELPAVPEAARDRADAYGYARELEAGRNEVANYLVLGRIEELHASADNDAALARYLRAYDAAVQSADPRELLEPLLRIGSMYSRLEHHHDAETTLHHGLGIAQDLQVRRFVWQFAEALSHVYEALGNWRDALKHARTAGTARADYHQEQVREEIARQAVKTELEHAELERRQANDRARQLEELNGQIQLQNKALAARLGERAQLIDGLTKAVRRVLKERGVHHSVMTRVDRALSEFAENDSGWREFDQHIEARIPDFMNELTERAPNLTDMQRRICILMRDGASADDICVVIKRRKAKSQDEMETWRNNLDRHRFNILVRLRSTNKPSVSAAKKTVGKRTAGGKQTSAGKRTPKAQGMRLMVFLRFFGNEPGDTAFKAAVRGRRPDIAPADLLLCRHLRRGFSDEQIAEFYGITAEALAERCREVAKLLGVSAADLRDFLKTL